MKQKHTKYTVWHDLGVDMWCDPGQSVVTEYRGY